MLAARVTAELTALAAAVMLGFAHIVAASHAISLQRGYRWTASARDEPVAPPTGLAGRLDRASRNFTETFAFFAAAVLLVHVTHAEGAATAWAAWAYVAGRLAFWIAYAAGVFLLRSLIWNVGMVATIVLLLAPLVPYW